MLLVSAYTGNLDLIPPRSFGRDPPSIYCTLPSTMPAAGQSRRNNQNGGCDYRSQSELVGVEWLSLKPTKGKSIVRKLISKYELSRVEEYINTLHPSHFDALRARFFSGHFSNFKFERKQSTTNKTLLLTRFFLMTFGPRSGRAVTAAKVSSLLLLPRLPSWMQVIFPVDLLP